MIITVTLNPAVDKTVELDHLNVGFVNRVKVLSVDAGGNGINVSKVIKSIGGKSLVLTMLGGKTGGFIGDYLDKEEISCRAVLTESETRTNVKIIDRLNCTNTDINEIGGAVTEEELHRMELLLFDNVNKGDIVVFTGSIPQNCEYTVYNIWIQKMKELGALTILDAEGELLKEGVKAAPTVIKPSLGELERLAGRGFKDLEDMKQYISSLIKQGIKIVAVSMGAKGVLIMDERETYFAKTVEVDIKNKVGAGDAVVAALAFCLEKEVSLEKMAALSVAAGEANITVEGTYAAEYKLVKELMERTEVLKL